MKFVLVSSNLTIDKKNKFIKTNIEIKLIDYLIKINLFPILVTPNKKLNVEFIINKINPKLLILAGGNTPHKYENISFNLSKLRDKHEFDLIKLFLKKNIPILGICRGMQILNIYFQGKLSKIKNHVGNKHKIYFIGKNKKKFPNYVNSFHNWGISKNDLSNKFIPLCIDDKKNVEAMQHINRKIYGIMWHPEREKNFKINEQNFIKKIISYK